MKFVKIFTMGLLICFFSNYAFSQGAIKVCIKARGTTGMEERVKEVLANEFSSYDQVEVIEDKHQCHLYLDVAVVEQEPIRFYALGISIAYRIRGELYSRPTSDVAQFGEGRVEEVCKVLAEGINRSFLDPLRKPPQENK